LPGKILIVILAVALVSITLLDLRHPLQSLEGFCVRLGLLARSSLWPLLYISAASSG